MRGSLLLTKNCYGEMEGPEMLIKLMEYQREVEKKQASTSSAVQAKPKIRIDVTQYSRENQVNPKKKVTLVSRFKSSLRINKK